MNITVEQSLAIHFKTGRVQHLGGDLYMVNDQKYLVFELPFDVQEEFVYAYVPYLG